MRIVNSIATVPLKDNCQGGRKDVENEENHKPLPQHHKKELKEPEL